MVWGREAKNQYGEHGAGRQPAFHFFPGVDPYWPDGSAIPHVYTEPAPVVLYQADKRVEACESADEPDDPHALLRPSHKLNLAFVAALFNA